jgi:D-tyrosyl-tRNA(Tyr) deacylase
MRAVIQRVHSARVEVDDQIIGKIEEGLLVFLGVGRDDIQDDCQYISDKISNLRIFHDEQGKMNHSLLDIAGSVLLVSQFTLYGDARKGRRPSFSDAASPELGEALYQKTAESLRQAGLKVETGKFQAHMQVHLCNDGPVTILLDSKKGF